MRWARRAWAAPWSAIGLLLSLSFRSRRITRGVVVAEGAVWPRKLGWRYRAITFGHVVLSVDDVDAGLLDHEMVHVAQYERWGPFFVPVYLLASLMTRLRRRRAYIDNPFEIAARSSGLDRSTSESESFSSRAPSSQVDTRIPETSGVTVTTVTRTPTTVGEQEGRDGAGGD